jgi:transposase
MAKKSITQWQQIVEESNQGVDIFVGVDVHKLSYSVAVLSANGVIIDFSTTPDDHALLEQLKSRGIKITSLVYEAGFSGFSLARICQENGVSVKVVAANRIPRPASPSAKTDRLDCIKLVELEARGMLKSIAIPTAEQEAMRAMVRRRGQLTKSIREVKARIRGFIFFHGLAEPAKLSGWSQRAVNQLYNMELMPSLRVSLDSMLSELRYFTEERKQLAEHIEATVLPGRDVLQSVPGVGPIVSATFRTEIFASGRFSTAEQLSSYLGLCPMVRRSGGGKDKGRIMPSGQSTLRSLLIEASWKLCSKEAWAKRLYNQVLHRSGMLQKAIVAVAHKLAIVLWRLLVENRSYATDYSSRSN